MKVHGLSMAVTRDALLGVKSSCKKLQILANRTVSIGALKREKWNTSEVQRLLRQMVIKKILVEHIIQTPNPLSGTVTYMSVLDGSPAKLETLRGLTVGATTLGGTKIQDSSYKKRDARRDLLQQTTLSQIVDLEPRKRPKMQLHKVDTQPASITQAQSRGSLGFDDWPVPERRLPAHLEAQLKASLVDLRSCLASMRNIKTATSIINEFGIETIVRELPETIEDLQALQIPGFCSTTKMEKYGAEFIDRIKSFVITSGNGFSNGIVDLENEEFTDVDMNI